MAEERSIATRTAWIASLALLLLSASVGARRYSGSNKGPAGAIIATATLRGTANATGTASLNWINGQGKIKVNLKGSLTNLTMAHIHMVNPALNNPVVVGILPRMNSSRPLQLNPPQTFKGPFNFNVTFDPSYLSLITPGMTADTFIRLLADRQLYVNVHTVAQPSGAIQGVLTCKGDCKEK